MRLIPVGRSIKSASRSGSSTPGWLRGVGAGFRFSRCVPVVILTHSQTFADQGEKKCR